MSTFHQPKPRRFQVRFYMDNWGLGISETEAPMRDALAAAQHFVDRMRTKYGSDRHVFITQVKEIVEVQS